MLWFIIIYVASTLFVWAWLRSVPRPIDTEDIAMWETRHKFVVYQKEGQTYIYDFQPRYRRDVLGVMGRQAANADLSLDWSDVLELERSVRKLCQKRF